MGNSYNGIFMCGCVCVDSDALLNHMKAAGVNDIDEWLDAYLNIEPYEAYPSYEAYVVARQAAQTKKFGCAFDYGMFGFADYPQRTVFPVGACAKAWVSELIPNWTPGQIEHWNACLERLRLVLPGFDTPGVYFGISIS